MGTERQLYGFGSGMLPQGLCVKGLVLLTGSRTIESVGNPLPLDASLEKRLCALTPPPRPRPRPAPRGARAPPAARGRRAARAAHVSPPDALQL